MPRLTHGIAATLLFSQLAAAQEMTPAPEIENFKSTRTRAEVIQETVEALKRREIPINEARRYVYTREEMGPSSKTRAQVRAETAEAIRLGLVPQNEWERMDPRVPTEDELRRIAAAGLRATSSQQASR